MSYTLDSWSSEGKSHHIPPIQEKNPPPVQPMCCAGEAKSGPLYFTKGCAEGFPPCKLSSPEHPFGPINPFLATKQDNGERHGAFALFFYESTSFPSIFIFFNISVDRALFWDINQPCLFLILYHLPEELLSYYSWCIPSLLAEKGWFEGPQRANKKGNTTAKLSYKAQAPFLPPQSI